MGGLSSLTSFVTNPFDIMGTGAAADSARSGQAGALQASEESQQRIQEFLTLDRHRAEGQIGSFSNRMREEGAGAAEQRQGYLSTGYDEALGAYDELDNFDVTQDPGYKFRMQEGQQALQRRQSARGTSLGGGALKELAKYSQGLASEEYGAAYSRRRDLANLKSNVYGARGAGMASSVYDPSQVTGMQLGAHMDVGRDVRQGVAGSLSNLGESQSQYWQNLGDIGSQEATAPFQNLMTGMQTGASMLPLAALSDRRTKENIKQIGNLTEALPLYTFNYKGTTDNQVGLMAQDVEKVLPEAVFNVNGFKAVNYSLVMENI